MRYFLIVLVFTFFYSCGIKKGVRYFENIEDKERVFEAAQAELLFQPNDLLDIRISSKDNVAVAPFNLTEKSFISDDGIGETAVTSRPYLVKTNGTIEMPTLGTILVAGKTREELKNELRDLLVPNYLKDPRIDIELVNFRISIVGDVRRPGVYTIDNERATIIEAIALAGDMNTTGRRDNVSILREENGKKHFIRVNFLSDSIFDSAAYYLKQNDVIYVEQNALKTREASWDSKIPVYTSIVALSFSLYAFFSR